MVTNVTSLLKTVKTVEDEASRGTQALEGTIEAIHQEVKVSCPFGIFKLFLSMMLNRIGGVIVSVLASSVVDHRFDRSGQTNDYKIGICCFSAKHAALRRKSKYWLAWNQDNVSKWSNMYVYRRTVVSVS